MMSVLLPSLTKVRCLISILLKCGEYLVKEVKKGSKENEKRKFFFFWKINNKKNVKTWEKKISDIFINMTKLLLTLSNFVAHFF